MKFKEEINEFNKINGNKDYTQRDMLKYLCSKVDKIDENLGINNINTAKNYQKIILINKMGSIIGSTYFIFFSSMLYLMLHLHGIL